MACLDCERNQMEGMAAYFRWKNANIMMSGCGEHIRQVFTVLRRAQKDITED